MKRLPRSAMVLVAALALVPFLPLYVARTMTRSFQAGSGGDIIEWGWRLSTLASYWSDYRYFRPEEQPAFWLAVNLVLGLIYALAITVLIDQLLMRWERR
jgi:hypothetical protein